MGKQLTYNHEEGIALRRTSAFSHIALTHCTLEALEDIRARSLSLKDCTTPSRIAGLKVKNFTIRNSTGLEILENLRVTNLHAEGAPVTDIRNLVADNIPYTIFEKINHAFEEYFTTNINFRNCPGLTHVHTVKGKTFLEIAPNHNFDFSGCAQLADVRDLKNGSFNFAGCTRLTSAHDLRKGHFDFTGCTSLTEVSIRKTALFSKRNRMLLPNNYTKTCSFNFTGCTGLRELPAGFAAHTINLTGCSGLTSLPKGLKAKSLNLTGCAQLPTTPALIKKLRKLEQNGCIVTWPSQFMSYLPVNTVEHTVSRLGVVIEQYRLTPEGEAGAQSATNLFHRYLTQNVAQRGGQKPIIKSTGPFLKVMESNPQHLSWVEPIASRYLDGCVNQPVAGFSELSVWAAIADKLDIPSKLETARQLMVKDMIAAYVRKNFGSQAVEVEAINEMLRQVHAKLVKERKIAQPWEGIPRKIAYEGTVRNWVRQNIDQLYKGENPQGNAVQWLEAPLEKVADHLLEWHGDNWAAVAFPKETKAFNKEQKAKKEALLRLSHPEMYDADDTPSPACKRALDKYTALLSSKTGDDRTAAIEEINHALAEDEVAFIRELIRPRTLEVLAPPTVEEASSSEASSSTARTTAERAVTSETRIAAATGLKPWTRRIRTKIPNAPSLENRSL